MAYAAVTSSRQKLECLLQFPCMVLQIKKMQARAFSEKVGELLRTLEGTPILAQSRVEQLRKEIEPIGLLIGDFIEAHKSDSVILLDILEIIQKIFVLYHGTPRMLENMKEMLEEVPIILDVIELIKKQVHKFHHKVDLQETWENPRLRYFLEITNDMVRASDKLKETIVFLYELAAQISVLCENLQLLLPFLEHSSNERQYYEVEKSIKYIAERVGDLVKECMMETPIVSEMRYFVHVMTNITKVSPAAARKIHLEATIKKIFEGEKGIQRYLLQASGEIRYIQRKIRKMNHKNLDFHNLQSGRSPLKGALLHDSIMQNNVVGLEVDLMRMTDALTRPPSGLGIHTIVGMGGIGKTTLARKVFNHPVIAYHFHCLAWVSVSQAYQVRDLLYVLLQYVNQSSDKIHEMSNQELSEHLYRSLKGRKYLIVMDDIWSSEVWDAVRMYFPDDNNGSRIVLTSRFKELATYMSPKIPPHCMSLLDREQSWELLEKHVQGIESRHPELVDVGKQIAQKCQGLPLAIVVIAGILSRIRTYDSWKDIADSFSSIVCANPVQCLDILALSYNNLPNHLKKCFLYMGAFPEDCEIEVQKVIHLWIGEGFVNTTTSNHPEELAENYLEDLIGRNLILVGKRSFCGNIKTCRLHDLLRELCLREAEKKDFMHVIKREDQGFPAKGNHRRLIFRLNSDGDVHLAPRYERLRTFLCFTLGSGFNPDIFLSYIILECRFIGVLDLFYLHLESFPVQLLTLKWLRYLALKVTYELPSSISTLANLQALIIHGPWTSKEDGEIRSLLLRYWRMPMLRHLHFSVASHLSDPSTIDLSFALRCLQSLQTIRFASCREKVFAVMPHLKQLGICETKEDFCKDGSSECLKNLVYLHELEMLKCSFYKENSRARTLCWDAFPSNLRMLTLSASYLSWEDMTSVARLPNLEVLKLKNYAFRGPTWVLTEEVAFHCLKRLLIEKTDLVHWEATSDHFPCLQVLSLWSCEFLEELPFGLGEIHTLQLIEVHYCSKSAETSAIDITDQIEGLDVLIRN